MKPWFYWFVYILSIALLYFLGKRYKDTHESNYVIKIIGYYLLGLFRLSINALHLPIGFIVFLVFLNRSKKNTYAKRYAAVIGVATFLLTIIPSVYITNVVHGRDRYMDFKNQTIYEIEMTYMWEQVTDILGVTQYSPEQMYLSKLDIAFNNTDGQITSMFFEAFVMHEDTERITGNLLSGRGEVVLQKTRLDHNNIGERPFGANKFFDWFDNVDFTFLKENNPGQSYNILYDAAMMKLEVERDLILTYNESDFEPYTGELPVRDFITFFAMKPTSADGMESATVRYILITNEKDLQ